MRAALFGDSQAQGLEPHLRTKLAPYGIELVYTSSRPGYTTARFVEAEREVRASARAPFDMAIVVLGGNDTAGASYARTLETALDFFDGLASHILWIGPSRSLDAGVEERHTEAREAQRSFFGGTSVVWRDPRGWQTGAAGAYQGTDSASAKSHFTRTAYALQAQAVAYEAAQAATPRSSAGKVLAVGAAAALVGVAGAALYRTQARPRKRRTRR